MSSTSRRFGRWKGRRRCSPQSAVIIAREDRGFSELSYRILRPFLLPLQINIIGRSFPESFTNFMASSSEQPTLVPQPESSVLASLTFAPKVIPVGKSLTPMSNSLYLEYMELFVFANQTLPSLVVVRCIE